MCLVVLLIGALARPAHANSCYAAATQGTAPANYLGYCWLDFTGYSDVQAQAGGQVFSFTLPDGSTLSLTLQVSTNSTNPALVAHAVPSWSGSAIGNSGFNGIPGNPVLYEVQNGSTVTAQLTNITVAPPPGSGASVTYAIVAADGESSNQNESLSFTTNGQNWVEVAQIPNGAAYPTLGGVGTATVTETGVAGTVGSFAFASFNNPTAVSTVMVGGGLQGAMFAVRYASISVSARLATARANPADQFTYGIKSTGGVVISSATSTGAGLGPFPSASVPIAAGYPFVVNETMAAGSVDTLAQYGVSLTCTNQTSGSTTTLPTNLAASTFTFPSLQYGDAVSCLFTDTTTPADVAASASFPASVNAGQTVAGTVTFTNNGPNTATSTTFSLTAPANLAVAPTLTGLPNGVTYSYTAATGVITLTGMPTSMASGSSLGPISISYTQPPSGTSTVTAAISATTEDPNPNNNSVTVTIGGNAEADAATSASFPASVNAGQPVSGTVTFTNNGPSTAAGTTFSLTVPANLAVAPTLTGLPNGVTYSYTAATGVVTLTGMPTSMVSGSSLGPITLTYIQPGSATSTVTASISATTADPNPGNNSVTVTIAGNAEADAATSATFPASVNAGQTVSGTVTFTNNGPSTAVGTTFSLTVPANLTVAPTLTGLPNGVTYSYIAATGVITLTGMPTSMVSGSSLGPIGISYTQPPSGTSTVTAAISATTADPNPGNNSVTVTIAGNAEADAATSASFPASVNAGQPVSGTVTFTNNGPSTAAGTTFSLTVPANLTVAPTLTGLPNGVTYSYIAATGVITLTGMPASLASDISLGPITVSYTQPPSGTSTVTASITATTADPNPNNNSVTVTIAGNAEADAATSATFPASVNAGQTVSGTVTFTNNGPSTAAGTTFSLTVPANLAVAPTLSGLPNGATYSYTAATGVITLTGMPTSMASGSSLGPIGISYTQPASGNSAVTAAISATTADPNPGNNSVTVTIAGNAEADAATTASFPASVNAGQTVSGTVTFTNNGPSTAVGTTFSLTVPANLTVAPTLTGLPNGVTYSYAAGTGVITLTGMPTSIASGNSLGPIGISYTQPPSGTSTVTAAISATTADPNPNNNSVTATIAGNAEADAATTASFPVSVNAGQMVSGTVTFTNNGPSTAAGTTFNLTVPAQSYSRAHSDRSAQWCDL